jgi:hypothetical protein
MNYRKLNAHDAYAAGLKTRMDQKAECGPMRFSIYKLLECHSYFDDSQEELSLIGKYIRSGEKDFRCFEHCTSEDKSVWVKELPAGICDSLGRDLVGVLHGLAGDGVSVDDIKEIKEEVDKRIPYLLDMGEWARIQTKKHWRRLSVQLGTGESELDDFVAKCLELIDDVMNMIIAANPKTPSGPFKSWVQEHQ